MRPRLVITFLLIVLLPIGLLALLGVRMAQDEQRRVEEQLEALMRVRLHDVGRTCMGAVRSAELELQKILAVPSLEPWALRELSRKNRWVRQVFALDGGGTLVYPGLASAQTASEKGFVERTRSIWEGREAFYEPEGEAASQHPAIAPTQQRQSGYGRGRSLWGARQKSAPAPVQARAVSKGKSTVVRTDYGWHTWFWGTGMHYLFWSKNNKLGYIMGAEVDRMALLADIIAALPASGNGSSRAPTGLTRLVNARGKTAYEWGDYEPPGNVGPTARVPLEDPLDMWSLQYFSAPGEMAGAGARVRYTWALALGSVTLVLVLAAIYFYRENSRELREAGQRVSFVNRVSHELKTPLTNIRMYAEMLETTLPEDDEASRGYIDIVIQESRRLSRLITNVLTFARKQREAVEIRPQPADVDSAVEAVLESHRPALEASGIAAEFTAAAPGVVSLDADALEQILGNLVSNVEKYAADGGWIGIRTSRDGDTTTIMVSDRGPGIPAVRAASVFEPFKRLDHSLTERASGTGIGLSIARDLARAHGGDLVLESSDQGAAFAITLHTPEVHDEDTGG